MKNCVKDNVRPARYQSLLPDLVIFLNPAVDRIGAFCSVTLWNYLSNLIYFIGLSFMANVIIKSIN
ncbi:hypothetical protein VCHA50P415_30003 [Vibrio chagasii]|nr:hypothetical protein VCHA27O13_60010 [Vibrio chagasii]CAH6794152.1 hypothetical protein VCHA28FP16_100003 [Vibrio chagasii]CAH6796100.1 hypothetical protein VCHA36P161_100003 [Vibrio chagasii]CAH6796160.1 hypothetical protein VCHA35P150_100003 [Vibrio chagasii]CAH6797618.1 hypothetical protein VCHA34P126_100193 [Vibrio chagasii]